MNTELEQWKDAALQAQKDLATAQAELEQALQDNGRLRVKVDLDAQTLRAREESEAHLENEVRALRTQKDGAYAERNRCVALIARMALLLGWRAGVREHPAEDTAWEADWRTIVSVDLPTGQASWHFHDSEWHLLSGLPRYPLPWDGHSTEEKYRRLAAVVDVQSIARECMRLAREAERERVLTMAASFGPDLTAERLAVATRAQGDGT